MQQGTPSERVPWVDYAKGICILMVVMMHSTLGVEAAAGQESWMHAAVAFAKPFRMPDFFFIAGLFLMRRIDRDWPDYLDRKVVHFAYFYLLWLTVQFVLRAPGLVSEFGMTGAFSSYLFAFVQPFGVLWFIYLLPIFFVVTKGLRPVPPILVWLVAAALEAANIHTGITVVDEFASRFVYFYSGYILAPFVFRFAEKVSEDPVKILAALAAWAFLNGYCVQAGFADWPVVSLALGFAGVGAVIAVSILLSKVEWGNALRYCGEKSIVIYLAFSVPMAATRIVLLKTGWISDLGLVSLLVTFAGLLGALLMYWTVRHTPLSFLFVRPDWAHLSFWWKPQSEALEMAQPSVGDISSREANS